MLLLLVVTVAAINVPFGYWRSGTRKFSKAWFFHVHGAIPLAVVCRVLAGIHWTIMVARFWAVHTLLARLWARV